MMRMEYLERILQSNEWISRCVLQVKTFVRKIKNADYHDD